MILLAFLLLDLAAPARELARKIVVNTAEIALSMRNLSSLSPSDAGDVRRAIEGELRSRGVRVGQAGSPEVRVTLAENIQSFVWTVEAVAGTVILAVPRSAPEPASAMLTIEKRLLHEQDTPILDLIQSGDQTLVLEPSRIAVWKEGRIRNAISFPSTLRPVRDPRGRLALENGAVRALLFTGSCVAALTDPVCSPASAPARLERWTPVPGKNFFSDGSRDFYTFAAIEGGTLFAGVDGRVSLNRDPIDADWGSDIAGVDTACGGRVVLATGSEGDGALQAYRIGEGRATAVSRRLEFSGPITALWSNGAEAIAVSRDAATQKYAAYSLAIACGR